MKRLIWGVVVGATLFGAAGLKIQSSVAAEETKSIGTQAGETARDVKTQLEATSKKIQESAQSFTQWAQEEWRKFNEAMNQPAKT